MNYSNAIVSGMLSWLRGISNWAINLFSLSGEGSLSVLTWFSQHWVGMIVTLVALGLIVDWLVWLVRWRPYWVWFRRKRVVIDDSDIPAPRGRFSRHEEDDWDGEEEEDRVSRRRRQRPAAEPDLFDVDPDTAYSADDLEVLDTLVDEDSFRRKPGADVSEDPFSISADDPDAITFWQEDVFNVSDLRQDAKSAKGRANRR